MAEAEEIFIRLQQGRQDPRGEGVLDSFEPHPFYGGKNAEGVMRARAIVEKAVAAGCTMMRVFDGKLVGVGVPEEEGDDEEQLLLRGSCSTADDEGGAIDPLPEEMAEVLRGMDVDLTDSRGDEMLLPQLF
jgi:hypothetical protein